MGLEAVDQFIQLLNLGVTESRGGFIHDHHPGIYGQSTGYGDKVFVGSAKLLKDRTWVDFYAKSVEDFLRAPLHGACVDQTEPALGRVT